MKQNPGTVVTPQKQFLFRKMIMFAFSGSKRDRSAQIVFPAVENTRSLGVEEAWTQRYEKARHDSKG